MRRVDRSVNVPCGYVIDPCWELWVDLAEPSCECKVVEYQRNTLVCTECGTVYGVAEFKTFRSGWSRLHWEISF